MGLSLHRGPAGERGRDSSTSDFERRMKGALGMEHISLKKLSTEGLWGGKIFFLRKALDMGISLPPGPVGEPGGDSLAGTFERKG